MKIEDIMTKDVISVEPETDISKVAEILFQMRLHGVPVVEDGKVVGIITETDFFTKDSANIFLPTYISFLKETRVVDDMPEEKKKAVAKLVNIKAKDIMSPDCITVSKNMELDDLLVFFKEKKLSTLPVVDENNYLVGIVTLADIIGTIKS